MANKHIIFVPGKNPKPSPEQHRALLWKTILEGVRRADSRAADSLEKTYTLFQITAWNAHFYQQEKDISHDLPWIDALINTHRPSESDILEATHWHKQLDRILYSIADHVPFATYFLPRDVRSTITEINRYFSNHNNVACEVRELLKKQLRPLLTANEPVLLIAHSLGSAIAYDTLWELTHEEGIQGKVDLFLTLGSPLGMNFVQRRLQGHDQRNSKRYPHSIKRWANLSAVGDLAALDRIFKDDFGEMLKLGLIESIEDHCDGIFNYFHNEEGLNCHRSYGYLVNPAVGNIIANWWTNE